MNIEKTILSAFEQTVDSTTKLRLSELPINPKINLSGNRLNLTLECGFPCPFLQAAASNLLDALKTQLPSYQMEVNLSEFIRAHRTQFPGQGLRGVKNVIAVASGKGGVGKSTVAVNLAATLARFGARVGLLDADIYGPSIPLMLGKTSPVEVRNERYLPVKAHGMQAMSIGYLTEDEPALVWRGPMLAKSMLQMLNITEWDELDYLFIDLPPGTGDIQLSLVQKIPLTGAVIVTTPQSVATLDAEKAIKMFSKTNIDVLGIVENMSIHVCSQCHHEEAIFGSEGAKALSERFGCSLLGQLPLDRRIGEDCDKGKPTAVFRDELAQPFIKAAFNTTIEIARKPVNYADKFPPIKVE